MSESLACYTPDELEQLREVHMDLICNHVLTYKQEAALWQMKLGHVASHPFSVVLRMVDDVLDEEQKSSHSGDLFRRIGAHMATRVQDNDADYFRAVAAILEVRRRDGNLRELSPSDLGLPKKRGRPKVSTDASYVFVVALARLTGHRTRMKDGSAYVGDFKPERITREELLVEVRSWGGNLSDSRLSAMLTKHRFNRFMAEHRVSVNYPE